MVRCKFVCTSIEPIPGYDGSKVTMDARWEPQIPEDERFQRWTPTGTLVVQIDNPRALEALKVGTHYYLDLTPAETA